MYNNTVRPRRSFVRLLHAAVNAPAVDVYVNNRPVARGLRYKAYTDYLQLPPGDYTVEVYPANETQTPVIQEMLTVEPQKIYTVAAINDLEELRLYPVIDFDGLDLSEFYQFPYGMGQSPQKPAPGMGPIGPYGPVGPGIQRDEDRDQYIIKPKDHKYPEYKEKKYMNSEYDKKTKMNKDYVKKTKMKEYDHYKMKPGYDMYEPCDMDYDMEKPHEMKQDHHMMKGYDGMKPYGMHQDYGMCPTCNMEQGYPMPKPYPEKKPMYGMKPGYNMPMKQNYGMCPTCQMDDEYDMNPHMDEMHGMPMQPHLGMPMQQQMPMQPHMAMHQQMPMPINDQMQMMNEEEFMDLDYMMPDHDAMNYYENPNMMNMNTCNGPVCGMNNDYMGNPHSKKPWPYKEAPLCGPMMGYGETPTNMPQNIMMDQRRRMKGGRR